MSRGKCVFSKIAQQVKAIPSQSPTGVDDLFLHALFARIALKDQNVVEFETCFNPETNTIELDVPSNLLPIFNEVVGMQRGPKFQAYIDWLVGKQAIISEVNVVDSTATDKDFVSASSLDIWTGAKVGNLDDEKVVIFLPNSCPSVVGYNTKVSDTFTTGQVVVSLVWVYESGDNGSNSAATFDIQASVNISTIGGNTVTTVSNNTTIPTFNLIKGDVRETELLTLSGIVGGDMLALTIKRNFIGDSDPETEFVGILGLKVKLIQD